MLEPAIFKIHYAAELEPTAIGNMRAAAKLKIPHLRQVPAHEGKAIIVGGAPSADSYVEEIRALASGPFNIVLPLNWAHCWLIEHDIIPNIQIMFEIDAEPQHVLGAPHKDVTYFICSHCPPSTFEYLKDFRRVLWHCWNDTIAYDAAITELFAGEFMVAGGYTTFFRAINIAMILGYSSFEFFGIDSSFDGEMHIKGYPTAPNEPVIDVWAADPSKGVKRKFKTTGSLALQAHLFKKFYAANSDKIDVRVHGAGLLPFMHKSDNPDKYGERK